MQQLQPLVPHLRDHHAELHHHLHEPVPTRMNQYLLSIVDHHHAHLSY
jgi:hypothetical protein